MSDTRSKNNKINICKEIKYMNAYSGGQYDQSAISHELWKTCVNTAINTSFKKRLQFIEADEDCEDDGFKRALKNSIVHHNKIKQIIKFNIKNKESENKYRMHYKYDYITHPDHAKYYRHKISSRYGFRPSEKY